MKKSVAGDVLCWGEKSRKRGGFNGRAGVT